MRRLGKEKGPSYIVGEEKAAILELGRPNGAYLLWFRNSCSESGSSEIPFQVYAARGTWSMFLRDALEAAFGNQRKARVGCKAHNWQKWHEGP